MRSARRASSAGPVTTGRFDLRCHDLRDHTTDVHRSVDDTPFGGGAGMVLRPEPVFASVEAAQPAAAAATSSAPAAAGSTRPLARELAGSDGFSPALRALRGRRPPGAPAPGRRRAVDRRLRAGRRRGRGVVVIEAVTRLLARGDGERDLGGVGVVRRGRPAGGAAVHPAGRRSGPGRCPRCSARATTARIARWRHAQALHRTLRERPDLLEARGGLTEEEGVLLREIPPVA